MAAAMELRCWGGDWGLPSVHSESLIVQAYAKFSGAKVKVVPIDWTWKTLTGGLQFNADYELTARQGADTMAYIALLEEKLRPALLHTFWVDAENYANLTRPWFASRSPFPLNFLVPSHHANTALSRILLTKGEASLHGITEVEGKIYSDAKECLNLLSYRLGTANYFFGNLPTSLDAFVFGFVAPIYKASLPSSPLQSHLRQLDNLTSFCDNILAVYFSSDRPCKIALGKIHTYKDAGDILHYIHTQAHTMTNTISLSLLLTAFISLHACFLYLLYFCSNTSIDSLLSFLWEGQHVDERCRPDSTSSNQKVVIQGKYGLNGK
uniref:Metaxin 3 n=1 Tax=Cyclopterus lumpus TaxID=8103 RepID=A0A8C3ASY2_CYCLU